MSDVQDLNDVKAGDYVLVVLRWDEITSEPGKPLDFVRHRRGDTVTLNVGDAKRLWAAGAIRKVGEELDQSFVAGPSVAPGADTAAAAVPTAVATPVPGPAGAQAGTAAAPAGGAAGADGTGAPAGDLTDEQKLDAILADPTSHRIKDVVDALAKRGNDVDVAKKVLELEQGGQSRPTLTKPLEELIAAGGDAS